MSLPTGTITFLFTDIEGSTRLWEELPDAMSSAVARHDTLVRAAIDQFSGHVFKTVGDAFCAAFHRAPDALSAALSAQLALNAEPWPIHIHIHIKVRMALHTGSAEIRDNDYFGQTLNRLARLLSVGHGGQILLSGVASELMRDALPAGAQLQSLGEHRLKDLSRPESIFTLLHPSLPTITLPLRSLSAPSVPNNLPLQLTSFVGRQNEVQEIKHLLGKTRLLTLTGSGGCGKSRLSLEVSAEALEEFADGAWFAELAPISEPAQVAQAVAQVLNVNEVGGISQTELIIDRLSNRRTLLILDNCEHLLSAAGNLCNALLLVCPHLKILANSRETLGIGGELTYRVPSLTLPDLTRESTKETVNEYESVRLFVERALFHLPDFEVTDENAQTLATMCNRLDGIPLAIELAAARVRSLSLDEINSRLDNSFRLLTGGSRSALPRQQTLRALIDWSYNLLSDSQKALLQALSVFAGGWTLDAAEHVVAGEYPHGVLIEDWEVVDQLAELTDKSLAVPDTSKDKTRYRLLETIRQYAQEMLIESGSAELVRGRHRDYYTNMAHDLTPHLLHGDQKRCLEQLTAEQDNMRQVLSFCLGNNDTPGLTLAGDLAAMWRMRGMLQEGLNWLKRFLSLMPAAPEPARANAQMGAGTLAYLQSFTDQARTYFTEACKLYQSSGDQHGLANAQHGLGNVCHTEQNYEEATKWFESSLNLRIDQNDERGVAASRHSLGNIEIRRGNYDEAQALLEAAIAIRRRLDDKVSLAMSLGGLGQVLQARDDPGGALPYFQEVLTVFYSMGISWSVALTLGNIALVYWDQGRHNDAIKLTGAMLSLRRATNFLIPAPEQKQFDERLSRMREQVGEDAFELAWAEGESLGVENAVELALRDEHTDDLNSLRAGDR